MVLSYTSKDALHNSQDDLYTPLEIQVMSFIFFLLFQRDPILFRSCIVEWATPISNLLLITFQFICKNSHAFISPINDWSVAPPFPEAFAAAQRR